MPFTTAENIMILAGVLVSPVARIALLPAIGMTKSGMARYHISI